eukprot:6478746-Amphidinium_carterae.1
MMFKKGFRTWWGYLIMMFKRNSRLLRYARKLLCQPVNSQTINNVSKPQDAPARPTKRRLTTDAHYRPDLRTPRPSRSPQTISGFAAACLQLEFIFAEPNIIM